MKGMKDSVQVSTPNLHEHNFSHTINTSFDFYQFRPVLCKQMYPKDTFKVSISDYFRAEPLAGAVYGRFIKKYACFFVPNRILWKDWLNFTTGGSNGRLEFEVPYVTLKDFARVAGVIKDAILNAEDEEEESQYMAVYRHLLDYWKDLGVPSELFYGYGESALIDEQLRSDIDDFKIPVLNFLACRSIWFNWFRDQNLIGDDLHEIYCPTQVAGRRTVSYQAVDYKYFSGRQFTFLGPLPIAVEKDYFTTAMTEPQRGNAAFVPVQLPSIDLNPGLYFNDGTGAQYVSTNIMVKRPNNSVNTQTVGISNNSKYGNDTNIIGMFDMAVLRYAKGVQKYLEKNNIAGSSPLQQLLAHWGIAPNPLVFNRPIYIGSFEDDMQLQEVVSPSDIGDTSIAGEVSTKLNMTGHGSFDFTAQEHGFFVIVQYARPENTYVGGYRRENLHGCLGNGRFDFFTSELEKTNMQAMYAFEKSSVIFKKFAESIPLDASAGFVPRYAETKREYNEYRGQLAFDFNSNLRVTRDFESFDQISENELFINTGFTMVYGYPIDLQYDKFFAVVNPELDHFSGWIHFDFKCSSERSEYASPLIEDAKGNDITLPYAGVRM